MADGVCVALGMTLGVAVNDGPGVLVGTKVTKVGTASDSSLVAVLVAVHVKVAVAVRGTVKLAAVARAGPGVVDKGIANARWKNSRIQSGAATTSMSSRKIFSIGSSISACDNLKYVLF